MAVDEVRAQKVTEKMNKLLEYRKALTIDEAAEQLGLAFGERVKPQDVLRLGLDGHLTLSVDLFNLAPGQFGKLIPEKEVVVHIHIKDSLVEASCPEIENAVPLEKNLRAIFFPELSPKIRGLEDEGKIEIKIMATKFPGASWVQFFGEVQFLNGIWDLVMEGPVRLDIEARYRLLSGASQVTVHSLSSYLLQRQPQEFARLLETEKPLTPKIIDDPFSIAQGVLHASSLPNDAQLVVRTSELKKLVERESRDKIEPERPLATTERNTLLCMISALCTKAGINPSERGSASRIVRLLDKQGTPLSEETVRKHLRKIEDAVEARTK